MSRRRDRWLAALGLLALLALHLDFWRAKPAVLLGGWLPQELAWRTAWMVLAWLYMVWCCRRLWPDGR